MSTDLFGIHCVLNFVLGIKIQTFMSHIPCHEDICATVTDGAKLMMNWKARW